MPLVDWSDPANWRKYYRYRVSGRSIHSSPPRTTLAERQTEIFSFSRKLHRPTLFRRNQMVIDALGLTEASIIVIIGGGWGWSQEVFEEMLLGITVATVDNSTLVQATKGDPELNWVSQDIPPGFDSAKWLPFMHDGEPRMKRDVLAKDINVNRERQEIIRSLPRSPDWIISEDVLTSLLDNEILALDGAMRKAGPTAHFIGQTFVDVFNVKSLSDWQAMLPDSTIIYEGDSTAVFG